jgi:hypothetical protein
MAKVHDLPATERAFLLLDEELVLLQSCKDRANMQQVFQPAGAIDQNIVKKNKDGPTEEWVKHLVH